MKIGVLSDTHGILRNEFVDVLKTCDYIIHAGDIGTERCYDELKKLKIPFYAVRGNCDYGNWAKYLPETLSFPIDGQIFYLIHNLSHLSLLPDEPDVIIFGHTHTQTAYEKRGCLYLNPGSASNARDTYGASIAIITLDGKHIKYQFVNKSRR